MKIFDINLLYKVAFFTLVWMILREDFSWQTAALGVFFSSVCIIYSQKFIPVKSFENVHIHKLLLYLLFLIWQIYLSGFYVIYLIIKGARAEIVTVKTKITHPTLRVMLADSITLTPGSILVDLTNENITVVCLMGRDYPVGDERAATFIKGSLEERLLKTLKKRRGAAA